MPVLGCRFCSSTVLFFNRRAVSSSHTHRCLTSFQDYGLDIDYNTANAATSLFIMYKPGVSSIPMALFGKGAYQSYSRGGGWGVYAQENDPWTSKRIVGFKGGCRGCMHGFRVAVSVSAGFLSAQVHW